MFMEPPAKVGAGDYICNASKEDDDFWYTVYIFVFNEEKVGIYEVYCSCCNIINGFLPTIYE